jgi:hypothetical protein
MIGLPAAEASNGNKTASREGIHCGTPGGTAPRTPSLNSPSRARTYDLAVNSRSLYLLSYRGTKPKSTANGDEPATASIIGKTPTDFKHFVKIYHRVPIEKRCLCWTSWSGCDRVHALPVLCRAVRQKSATACSFPRGTSLPPRLRNTDGPARILGVYGSNR